MRYPAFKGFALLFYIFFLTVCQPFSYSHLESVGDIDKLDIEKGTEWSSLPSRSGEPEFKEVVSSDKLDLVFILDTSPGMEFFYQKKLFGDSFLQRFTQYDWKWTYTDMSVEVEKLLREEDKSEEVKKSCPFLSGLVMTGTGLYFGQPHIGAFGIQNLFRCFSNLQVFSASEKSKSSFANGASLPLEFQGTKWEQAQKKSLSVSVKNYNEIFDHTVRLGNEPKRASFKAPEQRDSRAYPFLSMVFSMSHLGWSSNTSSQKPLGSFFRKKSVIVYVLVTINDFQAAIQPDYFKESVESFFGSAERLKLIPVILKSSSSVFCQISFPVNLPSERTSSKLEQFANKLDYPSLDICSRNLPDELFAEISKYLYPKDFLSE